MGYNQICSLLKNFLCSSLFLFCLILLIISVLLLFSNWPDYFAYLERNDSSTFKFQERIVTPLDWWSVEISCFNFLLLVFIPFLDAMNPRNSIDSLINSLLLSYTFILVMLRLWNIRLMLFRWLGSVFPEIIISHHLYSQRISYLQVI